MKQLLLAATIIFSVAAHAQNDKYTEAMKKNLALFDSAKTPSDFETIAAGFQRIGDAEKTQWLPYYWQAMALARIGWMYFPDPKGETAVKVPDLDQTVSSLAARINAAADKAEAAAAADNNAKSEILIMRYMALTQQMIVDPQSRYMTFGMQAGQALEKAIQLNPGNPRAYYMQAMGIYGTPEQFGGGKAPAKPLFQKAVDAGKAEQAKPLHPHWSLEQAEQMLALCQ